MPKAVATKEKSKTTASKPEKEEAKKVVSKSSTKPSPKKEKDSSLFAVIATGGKQYKVSVGDRLKIEKIKGDFKEGDSISFDKVLLVDDGSDTSIGTPYIKGAVVKATITEISRAKKILVVKYKAKSRYLKRSGHRQPYFQVEIDSIK